MKKQIQLKNNSTLQTTIALPASKSISNRALIINALSKQNGCLKNISECDDTFVMVRALTQMPDVIDIMAAGTAMRFLSAYLSVVDGTHTITGTERMKHRPISILVDALRTLGTRVEYIEKDGFPPLQITGGQQVGGCISLPGNISSQYISALLMIGPNLKKGLQLELTGEVISKPYINLTLQLMRDFGAQVEWISNNCIQVLPTPYQAIPYYIENDWSAASYWYQMIALSNDQKAQIVLPGLFQQSAQGDSSVQHIFSLLGVSTDFFTDKNGLIHVRLSKKEICTTDLHYDFINQPDLAQTVVVTCCMLNIPFHFTGLQSLKIKETDRITALKIELKKLGYVIYDANHSILYWNGERCTPATNKAIDTYEDHRMAMAFAPCCLKVDSLIMNDPDVVSKSYPRYWEDMKKAGFEIKTL